MPARILAGAMCVQRFDDSLNSAIHTTYRISLRSSSMPEPRDPLLKVVRFRVFSELQCFYTGLYQRPWRRAVRRQEATNGAVGKLRSGAGRASARGLVSCNDPSAGSPTETLLRLL